MSVIWEQFEDRVVRAGAVRATFAHAGGVTGN
jgi:hypothetical protein